MSRKIDIFNREIFHHYEILEKFEAGVELKGFEVQSLFLGRGSIKASYVSRVGDELYLVNFKIPASQPKNIAKDYDENRRRRLILHRREINFLVDQLNNLGLTIVPIRVYNKKGLIKIEIALVKGLKKYEKREKIKKRDFERERERTLKSGKYKL